MAEIFEAEKYPELFFGFVAPIGGNIEDPINELESSLKKFDYHVVHIKITKSFKPLEQYLKFPDKLEDTPLEIRYNSYIKFGDHLRAHFSDDSFLAYLSIQQIIFWRTFLVKKNDLKTPRRIAYIINQFKRKEEIELLRSIYGSLFFQISVYSKRPSRVDNLSRKISASHNSIDHNSFRAFAEELVTIDQNEARHPHGQRVSDVFHEADFIINSDIIDYSVKAQIDRFINLVFGANWISPTKDEYGLYMAKSASLRTVDLSRQVGAAIFTHKGEIVALGANEVPKAGGGTYWCDEASDDRDYKRRNDSNDRRKRELLAELAELLAPEANFGALLQDPRIQKSQFMDALEYGRIIHAEMSAICDAARLGRPLYDTVLYGTTFPCHMCAKHIVGVGITEVVFLEPYPKSLASDLHSDAIEIEGQSRGDYEKYRAVKFRHFCGVSPRRYRDLFERKRRKSEDGSFIEWLDGTPSPIVKVKVPAYLKLEVPHLSAVFEPALKRLGVAATVLRPNEIPESFLTDAATAET